MANRRIIKLQQTLDMSVLYVIINETSPVFNVQFSTDSPTAQKIMSHGGRESPVIHNSSKDCSDFTCTRFNCCKYCFMYTFTNLLYCLTLSFRLHSGIYHVNLLEKVQGKIYETFQKTHQSS